MSLFKPPKGLRPRLVRNDKDLKAMIKDIKHSSFVSYDIETNGLYPFAEDAEITLWGVGTRKYQWSIPLQHPEGQWYDRPIKQREVLSAVVRAARGCKMCAHNGKFDSLWTLVCYDIDWRTDFDTMLAHYILDENSRHGLKILAQKLCGADDWDLDKDAKQGNTTLKDLAYYHAHDLYYTRKLGRMFIRELRRDKGLSSVYYKLVLPVANMFIDVQNEGVYINEAQYKKAAKLLRKRLDESKAKMEAIAPGVNWRSPKQIRELFFEKLGLKPLDMTKTGLPSTSESVLKRLAHQHEIPRELMNYRAAQQQMSFFIEGWQPYMVDSRIHPNFKIHGTVTGRPSCADPNLQQVPRDPFIRSLICAPPGWELIEVDLSQAELRIAAELAGERTMLTSFQTGEDVHWKTALREIHRGGGYKDLVKTTSKKLTGKRVSYDEAIEAMLKAGPDTCIGLDKQWKEPRKKAKAINFGYLYGMWWKKFVAYARDNYGVEVTNKEAEASRKAFFSLYPAFEPWHRKQKQFAQSVGYVRTLTGRKRRLPGAQGPSDDYQTQEAQRQAINSPVQSFASDINLMAALEAYNEFDPEWFRIIGTVHDSVLMIVKKKQLKYVVKRFKQIMSHPKLLDEMGIKLSVPIVADATIGPWSLGKSEEEYFGEE